MKKQWFKPLIFIIPFTFIMGLAWGLRLVEKQQKSTPSSTGEALSILIQSDFIPNEILNEFSKTHSTQVKVKHVSNTYDLIKEILNPNNNYDLVQVISYDLSFYEKTQYKGFIPMDKLGLSNRISADFSRIVPNKSKQYIPLQWDLDSFVANKSIREKSLIQVLKSKDRHKILLTASPTDLYILAKRLRLVIDEWVFTNQTDKMSSSLSLLFNKSEALPRVNRDSLNGFDIVQVNLKERNKLLSENKNMQDYILEEKVALKVYGLAINEKLPAKKRTKAYRLLKYLSDKQVAYNWSKISRRPSTVSAVNNSDLPGWLQANYIRKLPLNRISVPKNHFGYESTWMEVLKGITKLKDYPHWKNINAVGMMQFEDY